MVKKVKKRGALLTIWLVIMLIVNFLVAFADLTLGLLGGEIYSYPSWIFFIPGSLSLANLVFVIFLFMWKKWAVYAFFGSAVTAFTIGLAILGITAITIFGLVGMMILYLIMRPKWVLFE